MGLGATLRPCATVAENTAGFQTPAQVLGAALAVWVKADAGTSSTVDGTALSAWNDQSGNARHLLQGTGSKQPVYKAAIRNGLPVVRFDGTDDFLQKTFTFAQPVELFLVGKYNAAYSANALIASGGSGSNGSLFRTSSTGMALFAGSTLGPKVTTPESWHVYDGLFNGASSSLSIDEGTATTGTAGTAAIAGVTLGGSAGGTQPASCDVGEAVWADATAITAGQRHQIIAYMRSRWAI